MDDWIHSLQALLKIAQSHLAKLFFKRLVRHHLYRRLFWCYFACGYVVVSFLTCIWVCCSEYWMYVHMYVCAWISMYMCVFVCMVVIVCSCLCWVQIGDCMWRVARIYLTRLLVPEKPLFVWDSFLFAMFLSSSPPSPKSVFSSYFTSLDTASVYSLQKTEK